MFSGSTSSTQELPYHLHYHVPSSATERTRHGGARRVTQDKVADLITFLAVTHDLALDITFTSWKPSRGDDTKLYGTLGTGGTAEVQQQVLHLGKSLAFKRPRLAQVSEQSKEASTRTDDRHEQLDGEYRNLIAEVLALCNASVRFHPNIVELEAVCWDFDKQTGSVWPVLIFEKADEGDLDTFLATTRGRSLDIRKRLELCQDVAIAMLCLHRFGRSLYR